MNRRINALLSTLQELRLRPLVVGLGIIIVPLITLVSLSQFIAIPIEDAIPDSSIAVSDPVSPADQPPTSANALLAVAAVSSQPDEPDQVEELDPPTPSVDPAWWQTVQEEIRQSEYHITPQSDTTLSDTVASTSVFYQAPNRAQEFRTHFRAEGIRLQPRTETINPWEWGLRLVGYGLGDQILPVSKAAPDVVDNQLTYDRGALLEWYINDERGLEQGFTIIQPLATGNESQFAAQANPAGTLLHLQLAPIGDLVPHLADNGQSIDFATPGGQRIIHYSHLVAYDAAGRNLPAHMSLSGCAAKGPSPDCTLQLVVDVRDADYPIVIDPLVSTPDWSTDINQPDADFGFSVSSAGDVDNDNYDDIVVGAPLYDTSRVDAGAIFIFRGSATGFKKASFWSGEKGTQAGAQFGYSVHGAGDVNNDGYDDIIVGEPFYTGVYTDEGRISVHYGPGSLGVPWQVTGGQIGANLGYAVGGAGDVNDDGFDDILAGAPYYDNGQNDEGRAYLYYGSSSGVNSSNPWVAESNQPDAHFGYAVGVAGFINNDSYTDIIVGAPQYTGAHTQAGRVYVYHGSLNGPHIVADWTADGDQAAARFGHAVATADDVNGDGRADIVIGAPQYDNGENNEGRTYVYFGSNSGVSGATPWMAESDRADARFGHAVSSAADVNNDGYDDLIVGAPHYVNGQSNEGRVFVYYGAASGLSTEADWMAESNQENAELGSAVAGIRDANGNSFGEILVGVRQFDGNGSAFAYYGSEDGLSIVADWTAESDQPGARFGISVATAGDVNDDGYDDVIVGADKYDNGQQNEGRAFAYYGTAAGMNATADWTAESDIAYARFGQSVNTAGDVNGDGYDDILVGAPLYGDGPIPPGGAVFLYYGSSNGLTSSPAWTASSAQPYSHFGEAVSPAGDVNNDGYDDIIVGAPDYDNGQANEGYVYVYYGSASGLPANASWMTESNHGNARMGAAVATAGNVNDDDYDDIIIGAPRYWDVGHPFEGHAFVYHGSASGLSSLPDWEGESNQGYANLGHAVSGAGDVNGDGFDDIIVGAPYYDNGQINEGGVFVYHGSANGLVGTFTLLENNIANSWFGYAVGNAGDVDGDTFADIIIGAPNHDQPIGINTVGNGAAYIYFGTVNGVAGDTDWAVESTWSQAQLGYAVSTIGNVNGDQFDDIIVGVPNYGASTGGGKKGQEGTGLILVFYGNGDIPSPDANFSAVPLSGAVPLTVTFANLSTNAFSFFWQFGDGGASALAEPTHVYTQTGIFTVSLTVFGPGGSDSITKTNYITVYNPVAVDFAATPYIGLPPHIVTFTNHTVGANNYQWDYGDGTTSTETAPIHTHVYNQVGTFTVTLEANNLFDADTQVRPHYIEVQPMPALQIQKAGPVFAFVDEQITYTLTTINNGSPVINLTISDTLPANSNYVNGGELNNGTVYWNVAGLDNGDSTQTTFVVTASNSIVNVDYGVMAEYIPVTKLTDAISGDVDDNLGYDVAIDGDTAIIGAPGADGDEGVAYIYVRDGSQWQQQAVLTITHDSGNPEDMFGYQVGIDGDTAVLLFPNPNPSGCDSTVAYVFVRDNDTWTQEDELITDCNLTAPAGPFDEPSFGRSVSISGDTIAVGTYHVNEPPQPPSASFENVWVFVRQGNTWTQQARLEPPASSLHCTYGQAVALDGDTLIVGAPRYLEGLGAGGAIHIYERDAGGAWSAPQTIDWSDVGYAWWFGYSVDLDGDSLLVSARNTNTAWIFTRNGANWTQQDTLTANDGATDDFFGNRVSLSGNMAVIGAHGDDDGGPQSGSAYVFTRNGTEWTQSHRLFAYDGSGGDKFGHSVAIDDGTVVVGAYGDNDHGSNSGSVYILEPEQSAQFTAMGQENVVTTIISDHAVSIHKTAPGLVTASDLITYTLTVSNGQGISLTNLLITDTLPVGAHYVSGGNLVGDTVQWIIPSLDAGAEVQFQFAVTATETLVNDDYRITADGDIFAQGQEPVVTYISELPNGAWWNDDFFYRQPLTLTAATPITGDGITANTVAVVLDNTDVLIDAGKLRPDGDDLRMTYKNELGWHVLPAQLSPVISPTVAITFSLQAPITDTSASYWLYYGNAIAEPGPTLEAPPLTEGQVITGMIGSSVVTPTVQFWANTRQDWAPATITFTSVVTPAVETMIWDFGDGITVTESVSQTSHTYAASGVYTVTLTAVTTDSMEVLLGFADYLTILSPRDDVTITLGAEEIPVITDTLDPGVTQTVVSAQTDLRVTFSGGAITQTLVITHTPYQAEVVQSAGNLNRFDLSAATPAGEPITQFDQPVVLELDITAYNLTPDEAETLLFFYWDEESTPGQWRSITTTIDVAQGIARAETTHFSDFAAATNYGMGAPAMRRLPSVSGGGVDLLTGASTYVYPLELPPGTRGMQPNLSLVYNSGAADTLLDEQAGLVGHGFELAGLGWIQKDLNTGDYYLNLNGVSEKLYQIGASSFYRTEHPTYWQIEEVQSGGGNETGKYWRVTTQDGTQYQFGMTPESSSSYAYHYVPSDNYYRFDLNQIVDVYGNTVEIFYEKYQIIGPYIEIMADSIAWPVRIEYTSNDNAALSVREIDFIYGQPVPETTNDFGWRADYLDPLSNRPNGPGASYGYRNALLEIQMSVGSQHVRTYEFEYEYYTQDGESSSEYGPKYYHLMLEEIQEHGIGGYGLPPTNLTYTDEGHLHEITNGYGGSIAYQYQKIEKDMEASQLYAGILGSPVDGEKPDTDRWRVTIRRFVDDSHGGLNVSTYSYAYGGTAFKEGRFRGHQQVVVTNPEGDETITFFSLGEYNAYIEAKQHAVPALFGKPYRIQVWDGGQTLLSQTALEYYMYGTNRGKVKRSQTTMGGAVPLFTEYEYDEYGNVKKINENDERFTRIIYETSPANQYISNMVDVVKRTNSAGTITWALTDYEYDFYPNNYAVESITITQDDLSASNSDIVTYQHFDLLGNVDVTWTGDQQYATTIEYEETYETFPEFITYADGSQEEYEYDPQFGLPLYTRDIYGAGTIYEYDPLGRLSEKEEEYNYISYTYNDIDVGQINGLIVSVDAFDETDYQTLYYNGLGQLVEEVRIGGITTAYQYDSQGRLIMSTLPYTNTQNRRELGTVYDALGRPVSIDTRDSVTSSTLYNYPSWQIVEVTDARGNMTAYTLDALGRVEAVTEHGGATTLYNYQDNASNPSLVITDPGGNTTTIYYDSLGRKVSMNDPNMGYWTYTYDERGNLFEQTDARGVVTTLLYDSMGRLDEKMYTIPTDSGVVDTVDVDYEYPSSTRVEMSDGSGHTVWDYDITGRLLNETKVIDGHAFATGYGYDDYGRLQTMTYPDGEEVTYTYNTSNQVVSVAGQDVYLADAAYDPLGQPTSWDLGGVVQQTIGYDSDSFRPATVAAVNLGPEQIQDLTLDFDEVGHLDMWSDYSQGDLPVLDPEYDDWNRLDFIGSNVTSFQQDYGYDNLDNLTNRNELGLIYNVSNRPHLLGEDSEGTSYQYDANGNMTSRTLSSGMVISYTYDAENRLTQVISNTISEPVTATFAYDGNSEMVKRVASDNIQRFYVGDYAEFAETQQLDPAAYPTNISNSPSVDSGFSCIALDGLGMANFVWLEDNSVLFRTIDTPPVTLTDDAQTVAIAIGTDRRIHVVWNSWDSLQHHIYYRYFADGAWSAPVQVSDVNVPGAPQGEDNRNPSVAVDMDNNIHIVWHGDVYSQPPIPGNSFYHRLVDTNGTWSSINQIPGSYMDYEGIVDLAADANGVHMVWGLGHSTEYSYGPVSYSRWDGTGWTDGIVLAQNSNHPTVDVDDGGTIHVAWAQENTNNIAYRYKDTGVWSTTEVIPSSNSSPPAIAAGGDSNVYLAWDNVYSFRGLSGWLSPVSVFPGHSSFDTSNCRMAYNGAGAHLTYNTDNSNGFSDVFYLRLLAYDVTKRYFAGGQQIATRLDDDSLYYHVNDPTGTSLVMVDVNGDEVGRMLYDGFGGVLTSTVPITLTGVLPDVPDAATGLAHLGGGRWYDPALGRPLQPNPAGGPPTVPQALNRYAATPLGQPGVAQAATNNPFATAFWHQAPGAVMGLAIDLAPASKLLETQTWGLIETSYLPTKGFAGVVSRFTTSRFGQAFTRLPFGWGTKVSAWYTGRYSSAVIKMRLDQGGSLADELLGGGGVVSTRYANARLLRKWEVPIIKRGTSGGLYPGRTILKSSGVAFLISAGIQVYDDWGNPYLTVGQKIRRAVSSGGISFASAATGGLVGTAIGGPVGTVVGTVVGFGVGLWSELHLTPRIFEWMGDTPERRLSPLP